MHIPTNSTARVSGGSEATCISRSSPGVYLFVFFLSSCQGTDSWMCQEWVDQFECGEVRIEDYFECENFSNVGFDYSEFFSCLTDEARCDEEAGILDTEGWTDCYALLADLAIGR